MSKRGIMGVKLSLGQMQRMNALPTRHAQLMAELVETEMPQHQLAAAVGITPFDVNFIEQGFQTAGWFLRRKIRRAIAEWEAENKELL